MSSLSVAKLSLAIVAISFAVSQNGLSAAEPGRGFRLPFKLTSWFTKSSVNVHPHKCNDCGQVHDAGVECIERIPIEECVTGKKRVYECKTAYEYVSIPEVRYRWKTRWVTKEIPAEGCKPVCKTQDGENCYGAERWEKDDLGCSKLHCKIVDQKLEKQQCKHCESVPGQTTIKVRYKTCVKEPYTVYRQVKRPVCVKIPRYEKVKILITRYKCKGAQCESCQHCQGAGCDSCSGR